MKQTITVRQLLIAKEELLDMNITPISQQILHLSDVAEFENKYGVIISSAKERLDKLYKEYYLIEDGKIKMEDMFEKREKKTDKWLFWRFMEYENVKVGHKLIPSGNMSEEEFKKKESEILDKQITK